MTNDDDLATRGRHLGMRAETLRRARERATTQGEHDTLDAVEEMLREDVRRHAEAVRAAEARESTRQQHPDDEPDEGPASGR